ncbi:MULTISPECIES: hypothetical protein, partial [Aeromonas]|uniref:hypothetical protein n=1 Tax=Aeromonas media TaxID=651 RepID=UPI003D25DE67
SPRCQLTIAANQQLGFHFSIPIMRFAAATEAQITSLSADNRQPAAWFPFLDTDNAVSSGY